MMEPTFMSWEGSSDPGTTSSDDSLQGGGGGAQKQSKSRYHRRRLVAQGYNAEPFHHILTDHRSGPPECDEPVILHSASCKVGDANLRDGEWKTCYSMRADHRPGSANPGASLDAQLLALSCLHYSPGLAWAVCRAHQMQSSGH
jgi:hypothetical protein